MRGMRSSNLELYRIVTMFGIVAYHLALYTGLTQEAYDNPLSLRSAFILWFGGWGKTGINAFVLITGYFMCLKTFSIKKIINLIATVSVYSVILYFVGCFTNVCEVSIKGFLTALFSFSYGINSAFIPSFLILYLCIPLINRGLKVLTHYQYLVFLIFSVVVFSVLPSLTININIGCVGWYVIVYAVGAYVRLHSTKILESKRIWGTLALMSLVVSALSMVAGVWLGSKVDKILVYYWIFPSEKILAFLVAFTSFMYFKNLNVKNQDWINIIGTSTFSIYLIHDGALGGLRQAFWNSWMPFSITKCAGITFYLGFFYILVIVFFFGIIPEVVKMKVKKMFQISILRNGVE